MGGTFPRQGSADLNSNLIEYTLTGMHALILSALDCV